MVNKKALQHAIKNLDKAKKPAKSKDIIVDPRGQWAFPGEPTRIPSNIITMEGVDYPVLGIPDFGLPQLMQPGQNYEFPEANYVDEYPQMKSGGLIDSYHKLPKNYGKRKYSNNISATNKVFARNFLFRKEKHKIFNPNAKYETGGEYIETELTDDEIQAYRNGGFVVEEIDKYQDGGVSTVPTIEEAQQTPVPMVIAPSLVPTGDQVTPPSITETVQPAVIESPTVQETKAPTKKEVEKIAMPKIEQTGNVEAIQKKLRQAESAKRSKARANIEVSNKNSRRFDYAETTAIKNPTAKSSLALKKPNLTKKPTSKKTSYQFPTFPYYKQFAEGGMVVTLTPEEIEAYAKAGYIIEELD